MLNRLMTSRRVRGILLTVVLLSAVVAILSVAIPLNRKTGCGHLAWRAVAFRGKLAGYVDGIL